METYLKRFADFEKCEHVELDGIEYIELSKAEELLEMYKGLEKKINGMDAICPKCGINNSQEVQTILRSCGGCGLTYAVKHVSL
jgi:superfamily II DNA/RNA helicase